MSKRRTFIKRLSLATAGLGILKPISAFSDSQNPKDGFSFLHLTDMHVQRKRQGHRGYQACVDAVNKNERSAGFVLMGGDLAFDGNYTPKDEFIDQIGLYKDISSQLKIPYYHTIGNHDVLGWSSRRKVAADDPDIGKKLIMGKLNMPSPYYSFNHKGWHFVILDSIHPVEAAHGPSYKAAFGDQQLEWLRFDLGKHHHMPAVLVTHIAAFCHSTQLSGDAKSNPLGNMVVEDTLKFRQIIERHNVKAVLQGHSHVPEDYYHNGIWYITSQSVSAAWWGGNWKGFLPGYTVFFVTGQSLRWERKSFEWEHQLEPEDDEERRRIAERKAFETQQAELRDAEIRFAQN
jgi:3',5'-cyclic-AMP phosphodiesterase